MRKRLRFPAIDRRFLYGSIGFANGHIPPTHFESYANVPIRDWHGHIQFHALVTVWPSRCFNSETGKKMFHRVWVQCPICRYHYPFGRLHQHINTATCDANWMKTTYADLPLQEQMSMNLLQVPEQILTITDEQMSLDELRDATIRTMNNLSFEEPDDE